MSWWGGLSASFYPPFYGSSDKAAQFHGNIAAELERRGWHVPTGSEDGPTARLIDDHVAVNGRMRDVIDHEDAPIVLAWFVSHAQWCGHAEIEFEFDFGPRYRYKYSPDGLVKLKGVLDQ